jgi:large subunit ribosomal protein L21
MYAIIRSGGKQTKVREGDVIDVERVRADGELSFTPLLVVDDKGKVYSSRDELKSAKVTAKVVGESAGDKIEIFKYKAKTGYRKRGGHRQKYTTLEVMKIELPKKQASKAPTAAGDAPKDSTEEKPAETKAAGAKKPAAGAKKPAAAKSTAAKKPAAAKPAAGAKKPAAAKKKPAAAKPAAAKPKPEKES